MSWYHLQLTPTLQWQDPATGQPLTVAEDGLYDAAGLKYPLKGDILRTVGPENYAQSFGFQWNKFAKTQVDKYRQGKALSGERLFAETLWQKGGHKGERILEVGSGAGRFTAEILASTQAELVSLDYSNAVEANYSNNCPNPRLALLQASIYEMPFAPQQFDRVLCLGVLQHTPDFQKSVASLCQMVKPGGQLVIDFYSIRHPFSKLHAKYWVRPWTKKMTQEKLLARIERNAAWLTATSRFFTKIGIGRVANRFLPIVDIAGTLPKNLTKTELREWVVLDTFDMLSPEYDNPQRVETVASWVGQNGLKIEFAGMVRYDNGRIGAMVVRATRPV
jgi:ubiquinone/menaquinone biosynthesis C-methylase UbiE